MRRLISIVLLLCLGVSLPAAGAPLRLCLLENRILLPGFESCGAGENETGASGRCCGDCTHGEETGRGEREKENSPCCLEAGKLPNSTAPVFPDKLPPPVFIALMLPDFFISAVETTLVEKVSRISPVIRGPDSPAERRAVLNIWRI